MIHIRAPDRYGEVHDDGRGIWAGNWIDGELSGSRFRDARLGARLRTLMAQMSGAVGAPIPLACQDWANTKAAYRFLSNADVSEREILDGHFQATAARFSATDGPVLVLQDTAEFSFQRTRPEAIGAIGYAPADAATTVGSSCTPFAVC